MRHAGFLLCCLSLLLMSVLLPHRLFAQVLRPSPADAGWQAAYWPNRTLRGTPTIQRIEPELNFDWRLASPDPAIDADAFSARWTRTIDVAPGNYLFTVTADDGIRLWVDNALLIDQWSDHTVQNFSAEKTLGAGSHLVRVDYYERSGTAVAKVAWTQKAPPALGWRGEYFNNTTLRGTPALVRNDPEINFTWGTGGPAKVVGTDNFSARWTRTWDLPAGNYRFTMAMDDGARLLINGQTVLDGWSAPAAPSLEADLQLPGGAVTMQMEYYERAGPALAQLRWQKLTAAAPVVNAPPTATVSPTVVPPTAVPTATALPTVVPAITDWKGAYFPNRTLDGTPALVRNDPALDFAWGDGSPAAGTLPADDFSARWTRTLSLAAGNYRFTTQADDGIRLLINGQLVIDNWREQPFSISTSELYLDGTPVTVELLYFEASGQAVAQLTWELVDQPAPPTAGDYRNANYGVAFAYPAGWQQFQDEVTHYEGADGFFVIEATGNVSLDQFVQNEINHPLRPYGSNPQVENLLVANQAARLILPATDQPGGMRNQAALVVVYPQVQTIGSYQYTLFVLYASESYLRSLAETLTFE